MTVKELIDQLRRMPPKAAVTIQIEDQWSSPKSVVWGGVDVVLWDGDRRYPVQLADDPGRIVPGSEVKSDPPCDYDYALIRHKVILDREFGVIEDVWDA